MWAFYDGEEFLSGWADTTRATSTAGTACTTATACRIRWCRMPSRTRLPSESSASSLIARTPSSLSAPVPPRPRCRWSPSTPARQTGRARLPAQNFSLVWKQKCGRWSICIWRTATTAFCGPPTSATAAGSATPRRCLSPIRIFVCRPTRSTRSRLRIPHLSTGLKSSLLSYLAAYWQKYFVTSLVRTIGWSSGTPREAMAYPPEVATRMAQIGDAAAGAMPQRVFYAAWKYAQLVPSQAASIYGTVRPLLVYPPPSAPTLDIVQRARGLQRLHRGLSGFSQSLRPCRHQSRSRALGPMSQLSWPACSTRA